MSKPDPEITLKKYLTKYFITFIILGIFATAAVYYADYQNKKERSTTTIDHPRN